MEALTGNPPAPVTPPPLMDEEPAPDFMLQQNKNPRRARSAMVHLEGLDMNKNGWIRAKTDCRVILRDWFVSVH